MIERDLILLAYQQGRSRGTSLSLGYYVSPDQRTVFCQNPNSPEGVLVGDQSGYSDLPEGYTRINMSDALALTEGRA